MRNDVKIEIKLVRIKARLLKENGTLNIVLEDFQRLYGCYQPQFEYNSGKLQDKRTA